MVDRICLVTGANSGIGLATATALAQAGATVYLACRDPDRGEAARRAVGAANGSVVPPHRDARRVSSPPTRSGRPTR